MNVAIIPARGGSKRIPRKNIRDFAGRPMIAHTIECARQSGLFEQVIVSTDDAEISRVALEWGAQVPFLRPAALADDHAGTTEVVRHAVLWLRGHGVEPKAVCCMYATAPFMRAADVAKGLEILDGADWRFVFSATTFAYTIFRSFRRNPAGGLGMIFPEHFESRSQDLPEVLHDAGQFYWGRADAWLSGERLFDERSTVVSIPHWRVQDIDTAEDWERAELIAGAMRARGEHNG